MKKRIFIVHGWDSYPEDGWFPWLKKELQAKGYAVFVPQLPDAERPRIENWVPTLSETVGTVDENTFFVGHSIGCQTIARFLEGLPENDRAGGAIFVAGFFKRLIGIEPDTEAQEIAQHWLTSPIDLEKAKSHLLKSVAIFSDDDPWVPLDNQEDFKDKLGSEIIIEHAKGHFSGDRDGTREIPTVLEKLLDLMQ